MITKLKEVKYDKIFYCVLITMFYKRYNARVSIHEWDWKDCEKKKKLRRKYLSFIYIIINNNR